MTRILVVEDDPSIRMGLEDTLTAKGYEVEVVGRGVEGAERAISGRYDLLVLDVMLPDITGSRSAGGSARAAARRARCR
jgi:DNA-binding response OmpR family regulator